MGYGGGWKEGWRVCGTGLENEGREGEESGVGDHTVSGMDRMLLEGKRGEVKEECLAGKQRGRTAVYCGSCGN